MLDSSFYAITRTPEELSIVVPEGIILESDRSESGWACFKVEGPLVFDLVGILAGITNALAEAQVAVFALSSFDTDYILVKRKQLQAARKALTASGYRVN